MKQQDRNRLLYGMALVVLASGVAYACKDFLNIPAQGTVIEQSLETKAGVEGSLIAAYRSLDCSSSSAGSWGCAASNWVWGSVPSGDAHKGSNAGDQQPINDIETFSWAVGEAEGYLNQKWSQAYEGVFRANATLNLLNRVRTLKPLEIADADAKSIKGEALFLRAHYHFEAYRMWGHIPYYFETDTTPVVQGGFRKPNDLPLDSIVKLVIADLNSAIGLLPATPRNGELGRATSWTARAYKGRVQVYGAALAPALWDSARATLRAVQASNVFNVDANGLPLALTDVTWNASSGLTAAQGDTNFAAGAAGSNAPVDPRLDWTVGRDKVPYKDWGLHDRGWIRDASYSGPFSPNKNVHEQGASAENNVGWQATQTNDVPIHIFRYADLLLLLAEAEIHATAPVLDNARTIVNQIRARAGQVAQGCGKGADAKADSVLKATYAACKTDQSMLLQLNQGANSIDSLVTPWATYRIGLYTTPWVDPVFAERAVEYERRLELAMEGQRFFDLRRWGGADTVIANYVARERTRIPYLSSAATLSLPKYQFYPIPSIQIDLAPQLVQNPGW